MLQEREMWGITYPPMIDILIDMAWHGVHQNMASHFNGTRLYPHTTLGTCNNVLRGLMTLLCGQDYRVSDISIAFTYVDMSREEPVPKTFIVNRDCQALSSARTFNENGHTAIQAVSTLFAFF